ncbi:hypothetical protein JCM19037_3232 [Geomicrobium sp. JCM 19037]|uniref:hypothetical protein n=1 Tax=Geomicrobium sp. JCM 19037 TaxID=1460634 RepID=UPI00045F460E|nr:hypothetical protein [Geomicrobium sp. JCM 19037]GAK04784.1 hypothetical protein JCM19037_3232 [Geomicrobium sp. JCM 19037]
MAKNQDNQSLLLVKFPEQAQAFEALSELKKRAEGPNHTIVQAAVVEKSINDDMVYRDGFTTEQERSNDWFKGGIIGGLVGILGGPFGVLIGGGIGTLIGTIVTQDKIQDQSEIVDGKMTDIDAENPFILALVEEDDESDVNYVFREIDERVVIRRTDANVVAKEIEQAQSDD